MSSLVGGMWRGSQNSKVPGPSLVFSYRVTGLSALTPAGSPATQSQLLPFTANNPAQYNQTQSTNNFAVTASPTLPNNEPQQGLRLFVTDMVVRDLNGTLFSASTGTAVTANTRVFLYDSNYTSAGVYTRSDATGFTNQAAAVGNTVIALQGPVGPNFTPPALTNQQSVFYRAANGQPVAAVTGDNDAADTSPFIIVQPYDQLGIAVTAPNNTAGTGVTTPTATAFTVDVIGYWAPAF